MTRSVLLASSALWLLAGTAVAQDAFGEGYYVQIEAHPALAVAERRARAYAAELPDVNGFSLGGGWYGIALGPYSEQEAAALRLRLLSIRAIPRDAFIEEAEDYAQRFWPVGAGAIDGPRAAPAPAPAAPGTDDGPSIIQLAEESPAEARRSEAQLTRGERAELQTALEWAGFYNGPIDAAFGRGTRASMAEWQAANGFEVTGILTTRQRAALIAAYNAVLEGLGMRRVTDRRAGISIELPMGVLEAGRVESPFVHYEPTGDLPARVLLISEPGDRRTMNGLYEIMQTLEIVPLDGPRERGRDRFRITGENTRIVSHTEAYLRDGAIKGFTLIWPAGDEARRSRVLARMQASFEALEGLSLDPAVDAGEAQSVDLVAGLAVRQPRHVGSGFFADAGGRVLTAAAVVEGCGRITLEETTEARIVAAGGGVALLEPERALAPREIAVFRTDAPRLQSEVAVAGFSYGGVLGAPTLTFGTLADLRGLDGEEGLARLAVAARPGDAGGPVFDGGGAVVGMLTPREEGSQRLPEGVSFATAAERLVALSAEAGIDVRTGRGEAAMAPEDLTQVARGMTVLVTCWE